MDTMPVWAPPLTTDEIGLLVAQAVQVMGALEAACVHLEPPGRPAPSGLVTCGELANLVPAVVLLGLLIRPELGEDGVLEAILRNALTTGATGAVQ